MTPSSESLALIKWSKPGIIYVARNRVNGKMYVGQTVRFTKRKWEHKTRPWKETRSLLFKAIHKYGEELIDFTIVQKCFDRATLNAAESWWIDSLNTVHPNGYNSRRAGDYRPSNLAQMPRRGWEHTEESKAKMSSSRKGRSLPDAHKKHIADSAKGRKVSAETRRKLSDARKGRIMPPLSEDTKRRMSEAHKGKPKSEEFKRFMSQKMMGRVISPETRAKMRGKRGPRKSGMKMGQMGLNFE